MSALCALLRPAPALPVPLLILLTPLFPLINVGKLVHSGRYRGINQIARGADPRQLGLGELTAACWSILLIGYWLWMLLLLLEPMGRIHGLGLLGVSAVGFSLRRGCALKTVLVILTFEGAIRVGLLLSLCVMVWRRL